MLHVCLECGKEFSHRPNHKFCSRRCAQKSSLTKQKISNSQKAKHWSRPTCKKKKIADAIKNTMQRKYGVDFYTESVTFKAQSAHTKLSKYNSKTYNNPTRREKTCMKKYGVNTAFKLRKRVALAKQKSVQVEDFSEYMKYVEKTYRIPVQINATGLLVNDTVAFYIPSRKLAINYIDVHTVGASSRSPQQLLNKTKACTFYGVNLIHIFSDEWERSCAVIKDIVRVLLKVAPKCVIPARKCDVFSIKKKDADAFLLANDIHGRDASTIRLGLYHDDVLVSILTVRFYRGRYELCRHCTIPNVCVLGGIAKLFNYFVKVYNPRTVVSTVDRRYFGGNVYTSLGFTFDSHSTPNCYYVTPASNLRRTRWKCMRQNIISQMGNAFDHSKSAWENLNMAGSHRLYDCGSATWVWKNVDMVEN